jgi:radical SAM protein with 4Fe4S-binding SPASM domain
MKCVKERINLAKEIPLQTPMALMLEMSSACNFKCKFCPVSDTEENKKHDFKYEFMNPELYKKAVDQFNDFPKTGNPFKVYINGIGESSYHPQFVELVRYTTEKLKRADAFIIRTNASLLTPDVVDEIIDAGMSEINISVEAVNEEGYEKVTGRKGMFQKVLDNVTYLYNHRGKCRVYAKIIPLGTPETDEKEFFRIFTPITDIREVEYVMNWGGVEKDLTGGVKKPEITVNGDPITPNITCPYIFYTIMVNASGIVHNCCFDPFTYVNVGDINKNTLQEIWNGEKLKAFWRLHLEGKRYGLRACGPCTYLYGCPDFLTEKDRLEILERLKD